MRRALFAILTCFLCPSQAGWAETVIAVRTIRAQEVVTAADLKLVAETVPGMLTRIDDLVGQEARRVLYAGRPIRPSDVGPQALVERNDLVTLAFRSGALVIQTEGRSLGRGGIGDRIQVQNLGSRTKVTGTIDAEGKVWVSR